MFRAGVLKLAVLKTRRLAAAMVAAATLVFVTLGSAVVLGAAPASATQTPNCGALSVGANLNGGFTGVCVDTSSLQPPTPGGGGTTVGLGCNDLDGNEVCVPPVTLPVGAGGTCVGLPGVGVYVGGSGTWIYLWDCQQ